jgi:polyribonucleotide nucleotidyltransferase
MSQLKSDTISVNVDGKEIIFETGKIARQANGAVLLRCGETVILSTACASPEPSPDTDFFPLRVDYQEKSSAAGRTLGGFIKREGKPAEREVLTSRLIDRPLRPMFPEGYFNEVQVLSFVMSYDGVNQPDSLAICAASAALTLSDIPLIKPIAGVRVGLINGKYVINPTYEEKQASKLDLLIAGTDDAVLMIEGYCDFLTEAQCLEAIEIGHAAIRKICEALAAWREKIGKPKNLNTVRPTPKEVLDAVELIVKDSLPQAVRIPLKQEREKAMGDVKQKVVDALMPEGQDPKFSPIDIFAAHKQLESKYMREMVIRENKRCDGRTTEDIRPIFIEQSILPRTHGSSLFTRGETQTIAVCTLGGEQMSQRFEDLHGENASRFYLQYSFPPFSVGEVGRMGAPGRREVGHGKLAERAIQAALPPREEFAYTIRLESNITESNGSSSMATVCGCCLALMDAGVPIKRPIAGIAMGLILEGEEFRILSDILGVEDALGDMDFKVAGDQNGITAFQMDIKVEGITTAIMRAALEQAKRGRTHILSKMVDVVPTSRSSMSLYAPRIESLKVKQSKIGTIIGPGGKQIRAIVEATGVQIDIDDNGIVNIASADLAGIEKAKEIIFGLIAEVEVGQTYQGKVVSIVPFGVFVEILPGKEGLCHISEFDLKRIANLADVVKQGDVISVKVLEINDRGQIKLSRRATLAV